MKIEVGKYYKTREGFKAQILSVHPLRENCFIGCIFDLDEVAGWDISGEITEDDSSYDLIEEWKDPVQHEVIVSIYHIAGGSELLITTANRGSDELIGSAKVTITEGEFADD